MNYSQKTYHWHQYSHWTKSDADSILEKDSLTKLAIPVLENQDVVAVGSMIRICNDSVFKDGELVELRLPKKIIPAMYSREHLYPYCHGFYSYGGAFIYAWL